LMSCAIVFVVVARTHGWQFDAVTTGSMIPKFKIGTLVITKPVEPSTLQVGDIISFKLAGTDTLICHRIIETKQELGNNYFVTKGDANKEPDNSHVFSDYVKGKVVGEVPYLGYATKFTQWGKHKVTFLGSNVPLLFLVIIALGGIYVILTLKDAFEEIMWPGRRLNKERMKRRRMEMHNRSKRYM
jgi:signal peptidase I